MAEKDVEGKPSLVAFGVPGLDDVLRGGLPTDRIYLIQGTPGSGKTTLALQYLLEGKRLGETSLYVTLSETKAELNATASSHGWYLDGIDIVELAPSEGLLSPESQLTIFHPSELELGETTQRILAEVDRIKPRRVVLDSLSEMRLLSQNPLRYRRQILALKQFFIGRNCTVLMLDDRTAASEEEQLESLAHGVICLEQSVTEYGAERRRLRISKLRGVAFRGGYHDIIIKRGGLDVFPRLVAAEHGAAFSPDKVTPSGNAELDRLLGGGVPIGTSTLLLGPAGTGKSSLAVHFASAAADGGQRAALYIFDEGLNTLRMRSQGLGLDIDKHINSGLITVQQVDPAELSPGEFASIVRRAAEGKDGHKPAKVVVIDSLNGYLNAMPEERFMTAQLHEMLTYLGQLGVVTFLVAAQQGMMGIAGRAPVDTTYLADNVILTRFFEAGGSVHRAVSVVKKRSGRHELTIREMTLGPKGIELSEPLTKFHGILTGVPQVRDVEEGKRRGHHE